MVKKEEEQQLTTEEKYQRAKELAESSEHEKEKFEERQRNLRGGHLRDSGEPPNERGRRIFENTVKAGVASLGLLAVEKVGEGVYNAAQIFGEEGEKIKTLAAPDGLQRFNLPEQKPFDIGEFAAKETARKAALAEATAAGKEAGKPESQLGKSRVERVEGSAEDKGEPGRGGRG